METKAAGTPEHPPLRFLIALLLAGLSLLCDGCRASGAIRTCIVRPLTTDFNCTPVGSRSCILSEYALRDPITHYRLSAEWSSTDLKQAAERNGMQHFYYADIRRFSILFGCYSRNTIILYGE